MAKGPAKFIVKTLTHLCEGKEVDTIKSNTGMPSGRTAPMPSGMRCYMS